MRDVDHRIAEALSSLAEEEVHERLRDMSAREDRLRQELRRRRIRLAGGSLAVTLGVVLAAVIILPQLKFGQQDLFGSGTQGMRAANTWHALPALPFRPQGRLPIATFWSGSEVLVIDGGESTTRQHMRGAAFDPLTNTWRQIPDSPLGWRDDLAAVWTGEEVVVWGGISAQGPLADGAAYDPSSNMWRRLPPSPLAGRGEQMAVWTGKEVVVVGGGTEEGLFADGAAYDPVADKWRTIAPLPEARASASAIWTGDVMLVWGGFVSHGTVGDGVAYDPTSDTWTRMPASPLDARMGHTAIWTGEEMLIWGGTPQFEGQPQFADGAIFDPVRRAWRLMSASPLSGRYGHSAVWTGSEMIIWGGSPELAGDNVPPAFGDGARYDLGEDTWETLPSTPLTPRFSHSAAWTGREMVVVSGCCTNPFSRDRFGDAAAYTPGR